VSRIEWSRRTADEIEEVVAQLLLCKYPNAVRVIPGRGDGGVDVVVPIEGGRCQVFQIKSFSGPKLTSSHKTQIVGSLARVRESEGEALAEWNLVLPMDPTPRRLEWFNELTSSAQFPSHWRGLTYLDVLASQNPSVVDYYLFSGKDRLAREHQDFLQAIQLGSKTIAGGALAAGEIPGMLGAVDRLINRDDPHFAYDISVVSRRRQQERLPVLSAIFGSDEERAVVVDVFPRYASALEDRPITFRAELHPANPEEQASVEDWISFGRQVTVEATVTFPDGLPGGLPVPEAESVLSLGPRQAATGPLKVNLRVLSPDRTEVGRIPIEISEHTVGERGAKLKATDATRLISIAATFDIRGEKALHLDLRFDPIRIVGCPVSAAAQAVRFLTSLVPPNSLGLGYEGGGGAIAVSEQVLHKDWLPDGLALLELLDDLELIQTKCVEPLIVPESISREEHLAIAEAAALLRGETVSGTWRTIDLTLMPHGNVELENLACGGSIAHECALSMTLWENTFVVGTVRTVLETAILESIQQRMNGQYEVVFIPGTSKAFQRCLLDGTSLSSRR
jgi:hypothetical protein